MTSILTALARRLRRLLRQGSVASDRAALVALYDATDGYCWGVNTNWKTNEPLADWYEVETLAGRVVFLTPVDNNLAGEIPQELGNLTKLTHLSLHDNNLTGEIPRELGNLTKLRHLSLRNLTGEIP